MQDSITMAEVGSIVKVRGRRIATPFGPPKPGSTPTKMPSTSPTIMSDRVLKVRRTWNPCQRSSNASIAGPLPPEGRLERPFRHDDVEGDVEDEEHGHHENHGGQHRLPRGDPPDETHESC